MAPATMSRLALLVCATFALSSGCGGEGSPASGSPTGPDDSSEPPVDTQPPVDTDPALECGLSDHPCSFSEVAVEVLQRTEDLKVEILARLADGESTDGVAAWLRVQPDVVEVQSDELAVRFRLEGGRGMWILREGAFATRPRPDGEGAPAERLSHPAPVPPKGGPARVVVGPGSEAKKALVLSPYLRDFGEEDDAANVAAILSGTRGYDGGVNVQSSPDSLSGTVGLDDFESWEGYDVVHVSTHGRTLCDGSVCRAHLSVGLLDAFLPPGQASRAEKLKAITEKGVEVSVGEVTGREYLVLTGDFFRNQYPSGLDDTLVFLDACQVFSDRDTDLVDALRGTTSVVLGWSEAVYVDEGKAAAVALYEHLSDEGYPVQVAWEKLGDLRQGTPWEELPPPELRLRSRTDGDGLRIRDVVTLLRPSSDAELSASDRIPIEGDAGDGTPDEVPFRVRVDGVPPEHAADMLVDVSVDGVAAEPVPLDEGSVDEMDRWTVTGTAPLGYDLEDDRAVTFRAHAHLYEGGESSDEAGAMVTGAEPLMGYEWQMEATHVTKYSDNVPHTPYTATASLTLTFEEGQDPDEPDPRYVVTGGSVTYSYTHTYFDCTFTASPFTFAVTPGKTSGSALVFHTSTDPVTYTGFVYTGGPDFQVTEQCEGGEGSERTQKAVNTWFLYDPDEPQPVSADGRTIANSYRVVTDVAIGDFIQESTYTITRIR